MGHAYSVVIAMIMGAAVATGMTTGALAQQMTVKQCTDEWRANKAEIQAKGVTEKAYVAQCRSVSAASQPTNAPAAAPAPTPAAAGPTAAPPPSRNRTAAPTAAPRPAPTATAAPT